MRGCGTLALIATCAGSLLLTTPAAARSTALPPASIVGAAALAVGASGATVYAAAQAGLYRSVTPDLSRWSPVNNTPSIHVISPNPAQTGDLLFGTASGVFRSTDGGATVAPSLGCAVTDMGRSPAVPNVVYAASLAGGNCARGARSSPHGIAVVFRSANDGATWTAMLSTPATTSGNEGYGPLAVDPVDSRHVVVGYTMPGGGGTILETHDGGRAWRQILEGPAHTAPVSALAFDRGSNLWVAWSTGSSEQDGMLDRYAPARAVTYFRGVLPPISSLAVDPLTGRLYAAAASSAGETMQVFTMNPDGESFQAFAAGLTGSAQRIAITPGGYLVGAGATSALVITRLIGSHLWTVTPGLTPFYQASAIGRLGGTLSPVTMCGSRLCQFFDKGALEATDSGGYAFIPLVPRLIAAGVALPIGGNTSSATYHTLSLAQIQRVQPPPGLRGGTATVRGGTFVPGTADLSPALGYVVPAYFWRYLNTGAPASTGWLHDVGLPLSPALPATVTKGRLGTRHIIIQAFQYAILTFDSRNPPAYRVERANIGLDFATAFPQEVR